MGGFYHEGGRALQDEFGTRALGLTDLRLGWESYGVGADRLWFDDIAWGSTRIGC